MTIFGLTFAAPLVLAGLLALPVIWYLLRLTPPRPAREVFPPTRILAELEPREETPAKSPWWLTLLRLAMAALLVLALAEPIWNAPDAKLSGDGPVLVVVDDGWTSGLDWEGRRDAALSVIAEAEIAERPVALLLASQMRRAVPDAQNASTAAETLRAASAQALRTDYTEIAATLDASAFGSAVWVSPSVQAEGSDAMATALSASGQVLVLRDVEPVVAVVAANNDPAALVVELERSDLAQDGGRVSIFDSKSRNLGTAAFSFEGEASTTEARFDLPVELRNEVTRVAIDQASHAGAVHLLDERFQRRRVGLIGGGNADRDQPLLSPLYYIDRALAPFAEVREAAGDDVIQSVERLIEEKVSVVMLADIGTMPDAAQAALGEWIDGGGMLVRFAGPRLAGGTQNSGDALLPVLLRQGDRALGGTLSWDTPQPLASFYDASPFAGLSVPEDVAVTRQVLAQPDADLADKTWASLSDGTPLVTATRLGAGWIVLFHVTADAGWSNLPLSGVFVDMLRRIVAVSNGSPSTATGGTGEVAVLPPLRVIDGTGLLVPPREAVLPLELAAGGTPVVSLDNPPGLYGSQDAYVASNLFEGVGGLTPFSAIPAGAAVAAITTEDSFAWQPWLLAAALILLALDCLAVLWMAGAFRRLAPAPAAAVLALGMLVFPAADATAQDAEVAYEHTLGTRLAYVRTGDRAIDELSRKGLDGLTRFIASRTSLEPGPPVGVDIGTDELAFFPLLYWPVDAGAALPSEAAMARVDAFMKRGGSVLFDTRDQLTGGFGGTSVSANTARLREMLASLDIPGLEPVPQNHVLTRAFYLLDVFPGRYLEGPLWVEASVGGDDIDDRPARAGDGVSSILITANDMAGAWAVEADGRSTLPVVPPDPLQRTYAFRAGTNIVMYTLTGNYKADQVHIPALLERLGQ